MPYLDMQDREQWLHLVQLFLAAHPQYQALNAAIRDQEGQPDQYFLSADMIYALARWARGRHLLTRKDAARLTELAPRVFAQDPAPYVTLTPRVLGTPPRRQTTVLSTEIYGWLYGEDATRVRTTARMDLALTLEAACTLLAAIRDDAKEEPIVRGRAQQLYDWLSDQVPV